jgi:hypothetical protein
MPRKPTPKPLQLESKQLSLGDIELGIKKLTKRISDVEQLDPRALANGDPIKGKVERSIRDVVAEIFGEHSREARDFSHPRFFQGIITLTGYGDPEPDYTSDYEKGIEKMLVDLKGLIEKLEERKEDLSATTQAVLTPTTQEIPLLYIQNSPEKNATATKAFSPVEIFYSYSHKDELYREELETHLSLLKRKGVINGWHDRRIVAGNEWKGEIDAHLESAEIILLLISPDFIASDYCYDKEMMRAVERHKEGKARVIPIILRVCDWQDSPFGRLQALPKDATPIKKWDDPDEAFANVVEGLKKAIAELGSGSFAVGPSSNKNRAIPQPGPDIVQSWFKAVINPFLRTLEAEQPFLEKRSWSWEPFPEHLEHIHLSENICAKPILKQFLRFYPVIGETIDLYDQAVRALANACKDLQSAIEDTKALKVIYEKAKADDIKTPTGEAINNVFQSWTEKEHLGFLAAYVVNRTEQLYPHITYYHVWSKYGDQFLAILDEPEIRSKRDFTDQVGERLLKLVQSLNELLFDARDELSLDSGVPIY